MCENVCFCGGYLGEHDLFCPWPLYNDRAPAVVRVWLAERRKMIQGSGFQSNFDPGEFIITDRAWDAFHRNNQSPRDFLRRHLVGDWGAEIAEDTLARQLNEIAIAANNATQRIFNRYTLADNTIIFIETFPGSRTRVMTADEYHAAA